MIESSFLEQYGINLRDVEMDEEEFFRKLKTIRADTSLGDIVQIRSASKDDLKHFNDNQKRIYYDWRNRHNKEIELSKEEILKRQKQLLPFFQGKK